jgi:predicted nuclease of restriction endonuclease-like RecB superfamily
MLSTDESTVVFENGRAVPDRLVQRAHGHYVAYAERALAAYRSGKGKTRRELQREVERVFEDEPDCDPRRIRAFAKLLDERSSFARDLEESAADRRLRVFELAARWHPLVETPDRLFEKSETEAKALIAKELGAPWFEIDAELYSDFPDFQRLEEFEGYENGRALLARYNVAQVQACLYRAESLRILARTDFKTILRYAKLARLLHTIETAGDDAYVIELTGPASVLQETRRYGVNFARFLPSLLACRDWKMKARIRTPWGWAAKLELTSESGLTGHLPAPAEFDSSVEEAFARKFGEERRGWRLLREARILSAGQVTFVPDFVFQHESGVEVPFEIVGFWTPEYLAKKRETFEKFKKHRILLAVHERARSAVEGMKRVVFYKSAIKIQPVLQKLSAILKPKRARGRPDVGGGQ